jgi:hypothetical protein
VRRSRRWVVPSAFLFLVAVAPAAARSLDVERCPVGSTCRIPVPGMRCADGTAGHVYVTRRANAENLLVYLDGGGACWNRATCRLGYALRLGAADLDEPDWQTGPGVYNGNDAGNPFARDFTIVNVPYCSGDAHAGNKWAVYGKNYKLLHQGFRNTALALEAAREWFPDPRRAVLMGCSAGGIGVLFHQRRFEASYPNAKKYVINDAGTPFSPPHVSASQYDAIRHTWGADANTGTDEYGKPIRDFKTLLLENVRRYPETRFAFVSSYLDAVMGFFARNIGSSWWPGVIRRMIVDLADDRRFRDSPGARVFYRPGVVHCLTNRALGTVQSDGVRLSDWLTSMLYDDPSWRDVRPDLPYARLGFYPEGM